MSDPIEVIRDAQQAAGRVLSAGMPGDMTAVVVIVPMYVRALTDPASGWREDAIAEARRQIEDAKPPLARLHTLTRPS